MVNVCFVGMNDFSLFVNLLVVNSILLEKNMFLIYVYNGIVFDGNNLTM